MALFSPPNSPIVLTGVGQTFEIIPAGQYVGAGNALGEIVLTNLSGYVINVTSTSDGEQPALAPGLALVYQPPSNAGGLKGTIVSGSAQVASAQLTIQVGLGGETFTGDTATFPGTFPASVPLSALQNSGTVELSTNGSTVVQIPFGVICGIIEAPGATTPTVVDAAGVSYPVNTVVAAALWWFAVPSVTFGPLTITTTGGGFLADSGPSGQTLTNVGGCTQIASFVGAAFGDAAELGIAGELQGPQGGTNAQGAVTGSAFTAELWFRAETDANSFNILSRQGPANEWFIQWNGSGVSFIWFDAGGAGHTINSGALVSGTSYALALGWDGATVRAFVNGVQIGTAAVATFQAPSATGILQAGAGANAEATTAVDEVRISNVARYTAAGYVPATVEFASDANTGCLYHFDAEGALNAALVFQPVNPYLG